MSIRTFLPGDDVAQVSIYNEAAAALPKFKPATLDEVRRRVRAPGFDPATRFFAVEGGRPVGYATFHTNGRVSYPWCRAGHEGWTEPLFAAVLDAMRKRGLKRAFAAYRADWPRQREFFLAHGFRQVREMVNFVVDLVDLPTPSARAATSISPMTPADVPAVFALAPEALRVDSPEALREHLFENSFFPPESAFVVRSRVDGTPVAAAVLVDNPSYANPRQVDPAMPCFRLGAFGTEGMQTKRIAGLFSLLTKPGADVSPLGLDLISKSAMRLESTTLETLAAQVPSDVPHLLNFYQKFFQKQGSFPVFERDL
jgi:hypothetical protein